MPNGLEPKPSIPIPGTPQTWTQGVVAVAVMALLGHQGLSINGVQDFQEESEKVTTTIIEKIDQVDAAGDKTRRDFMKQLKLVADQQAEILNALKRLEDANDPVPR